MDVVVNTTGTAFSAITDDKHWNSRPAWTLPGWAEPVVSFTLPSCHCEWEDHSDPRPIAKTPIDGCHDPLSLLLSYPPPWSLPLSLSLQRLLPTHPLCVLRPL